MKKYSDTEIIASASSTLSIEAGAIKEQIKKLGSEFVKATRLIAGIRGRVVVMGIGKSGLVGRKVASTLSSTGTPAVFVHPTDSLHGELGVLTNDDVILAISYSGETEELRKVLEAVNNMNLTVIGMTGRQSSLLARKSDVVLNIAVKREACPYNLAPTASSTVALALGDALALAVMKLRGFAREDFAKIHPGGSLGRILTSKVKEIMHKGKENPVINQDKLVRDALLVMTRTRFGAASVVDHKNHLTGVFTDGDLRRRLQKDPDLLEKPLKAVMTKNPKFVTPEMILKEAAELLKKCSVDNLPVVDKHYHPIGILDERDILG